MFADILGGPPILMVRPFQSALVLLCALFAGCAGGGDPASVGNPTDFAEAGGGRIDGLVVSGETVPIIGALVGIDDQPAILTDEEGRFHAAGLTPGSHMIQVGALGYNGAQRKVDVSEGEATSVTFTLEAIPIDVPRIDVIPFRGYSICDYMLYITSGRLDDEGIPCDAGNAASQFVVNISRGWEFLVLEMKWQGSFANSDTFRMFTADDGDCYDTSPCYGLVYGRGYARLEGEPGKTEMVSHYDPWTDNRGPPYPSSENDTWELHLNGQWIGAMAQELGQNPACQTILQTANGVGYKPGCLGVGVSTGIPFDMYLSVFMFRQPDQRGPCCPVTTYSAIPDG